MRTFFLSFLFCMITLGGSARCIDARVYFYPESETVPPNSWFMIGTYDIGEWFIDDLNRSYSLSLTAADHKVPVEIVSRHKGGYKVNQVILKPTTLLHPGKTYQLQIEGIDKGFQKRYLSQTRRLSAAPINVWQVAAQEDHLRPQWIQFPKLISSGNSQVSYGCGDVTQAEFSYFAQDEREIWVKTQVHDLQTGVTSTYYLTPGADVLYVGKGMCSGAFVYEAGHTYKARFLLMDACGNPTDGYSPWITYYSPA